MRTLVTGGAGFIGSTLVDKLIAGGHQVTVLDNLARGSLVNLSQVAHHRDFRFVSLDVTDPAVPEYVAEARPEVVFHLAAQVDVRSSVDDPLNDARTNILGTINVAQAAYRAGVRKIVFTSSGGSIYGTPEVLPVSEDQPIQPLSPYAVSKVSGELYLNAFSQLYGVQCTHIAPANVYGPRQDPHGEAGVVAIFAQALSGGQPTKLFGDGGNTRDYVFVEDVADAFISASNEGSDRRRFNIGTGIQTSDRTLHSLVAAAAAAEDAPELAPARIGDLRASAIDSSRARNELGWTPAIDLATGIAATVRHFRELQSAGIHDQNRMT